ncbi:MAG: SBBP repeat-containing protein [Bacteroidetes bacterium]|nr:SBBP repeat-containing protein [Bacteroidota bacterium]
MKNKFHLALTSLVILICSLQLKAQTYNYVPDSTFNGKGLLSFIFFNNIDRMYGCDLQADEKLVMAGISKNPGSGAYEICAVRLDINGAFDNSFNNDGVEFIPIGLANSANGLAPKIKVAPNGKIVIACTGIGAGDQDFFICMLDTNGVLDTTFNSTGILMTDLLGTGSQSDVVSALDIDANGNIYVVGTTTALGLPINYDYAIIKVRPNGQLATTFSGDGKLTLDPTGASDFGKGIKVQADGKIVIGGTTGANMLIARLDSTGTLDNTFTAAGYTIITFQLASEMGALTLDQNERIVVAGKLITSNSNMATARYRSNGTFDPNYGFNGKYVYNVGGFANHVNDIHIQSDNKIIVAGYVADSTGINKFMVSRIDTSGTVDISFNGLGFARQPVIPSNVNEVCNGMTVMADGRIILTGTTIYSANSDEEVAACRLKPVLVTSIHEIADENIINIFPNPFENEIQLLSKEKELPHSRILVEELFNHSQS